MPSPTSSYERSLNVNVWTGWSIDGGGFSPGTNPIRNTEPRWSTEWKSANDTGTSAVIFHRDGPGASGRVRLVGQAFTGHNRPAHGDLDIEAFRLHVDQQTFHLERRPGHGAREFGVDVGVERLLRQEGRVVGAGLSRER
jgi:hypothetical protein